MLTNIVSSLLIETVRWQEPSDKQEMHMRVIHLDTEEEVRKLLKDEKVKRFLNMFVGHNRELTTSYKPTHFRSRNNLTDNGKECQS